jgi:hypothetical protein
MKYKRLFLASAALFALAAAVLFVFTYRGEYLLLSNEQTGKVLFSASVSDGETFSVSYVHSVNKSPVIEYYQIQDAEIHLTALRFCAFGAGMPTHPEEGQVMRIEDGDMVIDGFSRHMPYVCYFIGHASDHTLRIHDREIPLNTLDEPGQPVLFSVKNYPHLLILLNLYPKPASAAYQ